MEPCAKVCSADLLFFLWFFLGRINLLECKLSFKRWFSFGMQILIVMLPIPLREYGNVTMHWSNYFHLQHSHTPRLIFMTPCETDRHWNWIYTTRDTGAKLTIHGLPVTGEGIQFLHKPTPRQLVNCLQLLNLILGASVTTWDKCILMS